MNFPIARLLAIIAAGAWPCATALAQDADNNAVASAEDAFGTSVGHEQIGVYDAGDVRGFSPSSAGNMRIEGLYFDVQGEIADRVTNGETIRIGTAAQGYPFPAPTGIVDITLRKSGDKPGVAPFMSTDSLGSAGFEVDALVPLSGARLGLAMGLGLNNIRYEFDGSTRALNLGVVPRWRPRPGIELMGFASHVENTNDTSDPLFITTGRFLPPRIRRHQAFGPDFARSGNRSDAFGLLGHAVLGDWTLRAGLFRSQFRSRNGFANLVLIRRNGSTRRQIIASPASGSHSWSGEARVSRALADGPRHHLLVLALRGRDVTARYGGEDFADLGQAPMNARIEALAPAFAFGPQTRDTTRQMTLGASYSLKWDGLGEATLGAQRTRYRKHVALPGELPERGNSTRVLPHASLAVPLGDKLALYGSYVRGLEDAGSAPGFAANANMVLPAIRTRQYDGGLRWQPLADTTMILGWFDIAKPYIALDKANRYGVLGSERHSGVEFSVTSNPTKALRVVAGGVWQNPRVTASPSIAEPIGRRPVGQAALRTRFNVNWSPRFASGVTLDAYVNHDSGRYGTLDNAVKTASYTRFGGGARYTFRLAGKNMTARVIIYNIAKGYVAVPFASGIWGVSGPRSVQSYLTADF